MWVRPGWRRHGSNLPRLMGYVANTVALARWGRQTAFSIVEVRQERHKAIEAARRIYDIDMAAATIRWRRPCKPARQEMLWVAAGPAPNPRQMGPAPPHPHYPSPAPTPH